ncbi:MAG: C4-dicarboxylate ABC transporter substrate-binding protein [Proteobacteria bacterium]|nr:C4-dicarboxylate ABC transporter substrate-binding protein [Pseudomonadota bacterium]
MTTPKIYFERTLAKLRSLFGQGLVVTVSIILFIGMALSATIFMFMEAAAPNTLTIASGPAGSTFQATAEKYKTILAKSGVTLKILPSEGSMDNFNKLSDPKLDVDIGFVLGGQVNGANTDNLVSLGSISYQPLMIFYRGETKNLLSDFKGQRLYIGAKGSGADTLARTLLQANGIKPDGSTTLINTLAIDPEKALLENRVDAIFLMGETTPIDSLRHLMHTPDVHVFNFTQADGYTRRINYLNKLEVPKGSLDFGRNIPGDNLYLIGPTVELVARESLHPALSDLLLEAAREVHSAASPFKKRGEFPAPLEHEFRISEDAARFYESGKSFLYRTFPFWVASLITRALTIIVPLALFVIPALQVVPSVYRWRLESRIYRWYRALLDIERDAFKPSADQKRREELLRHLDHIEHTINKIVVPAFCGHLFYELRLHINFVRARLLSGHLPAESNPSGNSLRE